MKQITTLMGSTLVFLTALSTSAPAVAQVFFGETLPDDTVDEAAQVEADFLSNFDNAFVVDFEDFPVGEQASVDNPIILDFGYSTATLTGGGAVRDAEFNGLNAVSGEKYWSLTFAEEVQDTYSIAFSEAQAAFGFYASDMGDAGNNDFGLKISFTDDTTETIDIPHGGTNAAQLYFGYLNTEKQFTSVEFLADGPIERDGFGLDDVTIVTPDRVITASTPEPATILGLFLVGALGIGAKRQRKI
ncbi:MAG: PEP-CTERM sorting domain-containing protein [Microcoleaceae cyanobacterium]